jgi:hypothetical protein
MQRSQINASLLTGPDAINAGLLVRRFPRGRGRRGETGDWRVEVAGRSTNQFRVRVRRDPAYYATFRA